MAELFRLVKHYNLPRSFWEKKKGVAELDLLNVMVVIPCQSLPSWELTWIFFGIQIQQIQGGQLGQHVTTQRDKK